MSLYSSPAVIIGRQIMPGTLVTCGATYAVVIVGGERKTFSLRTGREEGGRARLGVFSREVLLKGPPQKLTPEEGQNRRSRALTEAWARRRARAMGEEPKP